MSRAVTNVERLHKFLCPSAPIYLFIVQGGREVSDFLDFIKKHATNSPVISGEEEKKKKKKKEKKEEL